MCSVFSNALSLGRKRNGTKILGGLSPLATPSQNQVPAFPYGLKLHYTTTCLQTSGSFLIYSGMDVKEEGRHTEVEKRTRQRTRLDFLPPQPCQRRQTFINLSTAASESERKRVLILLIYTAGRALGEQLPTA